MESVGGPASTGTIIRAKRQSVLIGQRSLDVYGEEEAGPKFVKWIIERYRKWGYVVAEHPWLMIVIPIIISSICTLKIVTTKQRNDITGYSPYGARANDEYVAYQQFFSSSGLPITAYLFLVAKDNGSMIRPDYMEETIEILNQAMNNVTIYDRINKINQTFNAFCTSFCQANEPVRQFYNGYTILKEAAEKGEEPTARLILDYPISNVFGRSFSLQPNFFGIETYDEDPVAGLLGGPDNKDNSTVIDEAGGPGRSITNMKSVQMLTLMFRAEHRPGWTEDDVKNWELSLRERFEYNWKSDKVKVYMYSQAYVEEEMVRGGIIMIPFLVVGFITMCVCSIVSVMIRALYMHQENCYKIVLAVMACVTPLLACATALAIMFVCGVRFASILCVIPFLVLSIGVDSSYLMLHEWQRVTKHSREQPNKKDSVGHRMSEVLSEVGPAILISCLTNMFADAVGSFTSSPEITLLCTGNMLSMCIAFLYQITFYAGLMSVVGRNEMEQEKRETNRLNMALNVAENRVNIARHHRPLTRQPSKFHENTKPIVSKFMTRYVNMMATPVIYVGIFAIYIAYLVFSVWGICNINMNLTAQKLFALDSPLLELDDYRVAYQVPHFLQATVFIQNPGNFSDPKRVERMNQFVSDFESINGSWGPVGTKYFMRDFQAFQKSFGDDDEYDDPDATTISPEKNVGGTAFNELELPYFLKWPEYDFWDGFVTLENVTEDGSQQRLKRFFFTSGFHGDQLTVWTERGKMLHKWREVCDRYPEFNPSVYHEDGVFLDLIDNMPTDTWQSVLGTLVCMAFVCFIFLNNIFTVAIASLSVLSICAGILGILSWWGIDLDPITMAAMIISIGFSVDIPAHVSYHYYQASLQEGSHSRPADRLANCLSSVAFPAVQAAVSTILCVCSLLFVKIYMAEVFVKTMVLCVLLCNLHGLVFLPAILIMLDSIRWACRPKGAAAQLPKSNTSAARKVSRGRAKNSRVQPEKTTVTDRPEV